ncbi:MAG: GGDEF/EAL domain-containing response regulator [Cellvibrionaceae bacterium]
MNSEIGRIMTLAAPNQDPQQEIVDHYIQLKNALIMMVDDEPIMMELVQAFLESEGYSRFTTLEDSRKALDALQDERPDVLLLDLNMPNVDGFEILEAMREKKSLKHIPVIVLTSANDPASKLKALELGATDFLAKPVDPSELALRLRNTLTVKAYQDQLAYYDTLTGLPNRKLFLDRLEWALNRLHRDGGALAVVDICLDRFKYINQSLGIKGGDLLLQKVSARMLEQVRQGDVISKVPIDDLWRSLSRLGGDEFSILLDDMSRSENAETVVARLKSTFDEPFNIDGQEVSITASVGISVYPDDGDNADVLMKNAGAASAFVKKQGGNNYQFFSDEVEARSKERMQLETDLRKAIGRGQFEMHYQPKVHTQTGELLSVEALIRWNHPQRGLVSPGVFIPLAEEIGFIHSLGDWVILSVCRQAKLWRDKGWVDFNVSLNVSPQQLTAGDIVSFVSGALKNNQLPPESIVLELTESLAMDKGLDILDLLKRLKACGVGLSIDDFGTGYSNLGYLKQLPFDELKIDRSFLMNIPSDQDEVAIITAIVGMAKSLGLKVVAEGVEELAQLECLRGFDVESIQGYYFSRPLSVSDFEQYYLASTR